jgi:hypothetical protein
VHIALVERYIKVLIRKLTYEERSDLWLLHFHSPMLSQPLCLLEIVRSTGVKDTRNLGGTHLEGGGLCDIIWMGGQVSRAELGLQTQVYCSFRGQMWLNLRALTSPATLAKNCDLEERAEHISVHEQICSLRGQGWDSHYCRLVDIQISESINTAVFV